MLFIALMALWLGLVAARRKKRWHLWALVGLATAFAIDALVSLPLDAFIPEERYSDEIEYMGIAVILCLDVAAGFLVSTRIGRPSGRSRGKDSGGWARYEPVEPVDREGSSASAPEIDPRAEIAPFASSPDRVDPQSRPIPGRIRAQRRAIAQRKLRSRTEELIAKRMREESLEGLRPLGRVARRILSRF